MKRYPYLSGPTAFSVRKAVRTGPVTTKTKVGSKVRMRSVSSVVKRPDTSDLIMKSVPAGAGSITPSRDTEETVERSMILRRNVRKSYFKAKARDLYDDSTAINTKLSRLESDMDGKLNTWVSQLNGAKEELQELVDDLRGLHTKPNEVLSWIIDFAGSLGASSVGNARTQTKVAVQEATYTLDMVTQKISAIENYRNDLARRMKRDQLRSWKSGSNQVDMIENVSRSFGIDQRDMLQGWWDQAYLDDMFALGDNKPWQPTCDLYQHLIRPRSFDNIRLWMDGPPDESAPVSSPFGISFAFGGYGDTTAGGTVSGDKYVYYRQPRPGQAGHDAMAYSRGNQAVPRVDPWGRSLLQNGCIPGEACPIGAFEVPSPRTRAIIAYQNYGLQLVTTSDVSLMVTEVNALLDDARSAVVRSYEAYRDLDTAIDAAGLTYVKPKIRVALEATGGPSALNGTLFAVGWGLAGPAGAIAGWVIGWFALNALVSEVYDGLTSDVGEAKRRAQHLKGSPIASAKARAEAAFRWWDDNTPYSWRIARAAQMVEIRDDCEVWMDKWNAMEPICRQIYPVRSASEWIRLGVPQPCTERVPEFELPGGWTPGDADLDPAPDEPLEVLTPYGALNQSPKPFLGISGKGWMFILGVSVALIVFEDKVMYRGRS